MAGKENVDSDLKDSQWPMKKPRSIVSLWLDLRALLAMKKLCCFQKALCQQTLKWTMPWWCRCVWSGDHREIGPKHSIVQKSRWPWLPEIKFLAVLISCRSEEARWQQPYPPRTSTSFTNGGKTPRCSKIPWLKRDSVHWHPSCDRVYQQLHF